jgi:predicted MFS family arabinose efflux permease
MIGAVLRHKELLRLDFGIFSLHAMLTASFLVVPGLLRATLHLSNNHDWLIYLPVLVVSVAVMVPAIVIAEKHRRMKAVFVAAVAGLAVSQAMLYLGAGNLYVLLAALVIFFSAFNVMEASLPSLITKAAPPDAKGTATGLYSSAQFLGIFVGGIVGGWTHQHGGAPAVFAFTALLALAWLIAAATMAQPSYLTTRLLPLGDSEANDAGIAARLRQVPGVAEAVVIAEEKLAYLKVDSRSFDAAKAAQVAAAR